MTDPTAVDRAWARAWLAASALDDLYGGETAWRWTRRQAARLGRAGRADDPEAARAVARALERRLERDRGEVGS